MLNSRQIKYLKSLANKLDSKYQIGKNEISHNTIVLLDQALKKNELIKVSVLNSVKEEKIKIAHELEEQLKCEVVQIVGNMITLFRKNLKDGKIHLPN